MEAGAVLCQRGRVLVPAGMNEAWRIFCRPGTKFVELYECRGKGLLHAGHKSWFTKFFRKHWRDRGIGFTNLSWEQE